MQTYPIIKYPRLIQAFLQGDNPDIHEMRKPEKTNAKFSEWTPLIISLIAITFSVVLFRSLLLASIALFFISIFTFLAFIGSIKEYQQEKKKAEIMYKAKLLDYEDNVNQQQKLKIILKDKIETENYSSKRIKQISISASKHETEYYNIATKGNSETYFLIELKTIFGDNIMFDSTIPNQEWTFPFIPDFVFSNGQITIDIEIHEPYTFKKHEPIHYFDNEKKEHIDTNRDDFFIRHNWTVVRFTEKQVYKNSLGCCKVLAEVIYKLTNDNSFLLKLSGVKDVEQEKYWTEAEAREWAKTHYRNSYDGTFFL